MQRSACFTPSPTRDTTAVRQGARRTDPAYIPGSTARLREHDLEQFLNHPAVQAGAAPFIAAFVVALALHRLRLGGLAVVTAFATAVWLISDFNFTPLTATRKIILLGLCSAVVGVLVDFAFKPTRIGAGLLAIAGGLAALWVFYPVLSQKDLAQAMLPGAVAVLLSGWLVGSMAFLLAERPVQTASAGLMLGIGAGALAILGASASFGQYGIALGAGAGAFLLVLMLTGRAHVAGAVFALPAALISALLVAGTMILAQLPWFAAAILGLVPLAVRMPGPDRSPVWLQAVVHSLYAAVIAIAAAAAAWFASRGAAG